LNEIGLCQAAGEVSGFPAELPSPRFGAVAACPVAPRDVLRGKQRGNIVLAYSLLVMLLPRGVVGADQPLELAVKATFITKLLPFVGWPSNALASSGGAFRICVAGKDPFDDLLDRAAYHQSVGGYPVEVSHLEIVTRSNGCQVLYAAGSRDQSVAEMLEVVRGTPVLTITDAATDPKSRGIVNFIISDSRVRFEIDDTAAVQNSLSISSKLLSLAVRVFGGR
jgi:hypothetical protein